MSLIDLSSLPAPNVVEVIDFETIFAQRKAEFIALYPADERAAIAATLVLESEPITKLLQENAYREMLWRQRVNDAAHAVMLAYARGSDLDNLTALLGVTRLEQETDNRLRFRAQMALEGTTVAGSRRSYIAHTFSASNLVKDVAVTSPKPGQVLVTVLATSGDGVPEADLLATVAAYLSAEERRPLTDQVIVEAAQIVPFAINATLNTYPGPSSTTVIHAAQIAVQNFVNEHHKLGHDITLSGLYASMHQVGVQRVILQSPLVDLVISERQAAYCTSIKLTMGVNDV